MKLTSTPDDFEEAMDTVEDYVCDIGDNVKEDLHMRPNIGFDNPEAQGFWCTHGSTSYAILGDPEEMFFTITYPRLMIANIAERLDEGAVEELLENYSGEKVEEIIGNHEDTQQMTPENIPEEIIEQANLEQDTEEIRESEELPEELKEMYISGERYLASQIWLESLETDLMEDVRYHLREKLSTTETSYRIFPEGETVVHGFQVSKKLFPYEEGFNLREFNDRVQAVVSVGVSGENFLSTTFGLEGNLSTAPKLPKS